MYDTAFHHSQFSPRANILGIFPRKSFQVSQICFKKKPEPAPPKKFWTFPPKFIPDWRFLQTNSSQPILWEKIREKKLIVFCIFADLSIAAVMQRSCKILDDPRFFLLWFVIAVFESNMPTLKPRQNLLR